MKRKIIFLILLALAGVVALLWEYTARTRNRGIRVGMLSSELVARFGMPTSQGIRMKLPNLDPVILQRVSQIPDLASKVGGGNYFEFWGYSEPSYFKTDYLRLVLSSDPDGGEAKVVHVESGVVHHNVKDRLWNLLPAWMR